MVECDRLAVCLDEDEPEDALPSEEAGEDEEEEEETEAEEAAELGSGEAEDEERDAVGD